MTVEHGRARAAASRRQTLAEGAHHGRTERNVRHKVAVHDVHVQPVAASVEHPPRVARQVREVGREERRTNYGRRHFLMIADLDSL
jgi:hypothetical protein